MIVLRLVILLMSLSRPLLANRSLSSSSQAPAPTPNEGGLLSGALDDYVRGTQLWRSRGTWYSIQDWAARSSTCANNATSVACMACSMERPASAVANGVAPIGVANALWFDPERSATCGMCLKVYMPNGTASGSCSDPAARDLKADCAGEGTEPYITGITAEQNYAAKVHFDSGMHMSYFIAIIVEWYDRNQTTNAYALSAPTKATGPAVDKYGTWPVVYQGVPCPVGDHKMEFAFQNAAAETPVPSSQDGLREWYQSGTSAGLPPGAGAGLCDNQSNKPCGSQGTISQNPLGFIKLQITGHRIPLSSVEIYLADNIWHKMRRSGEAYWEPAESIGLTPNASNPVTVRVYCADGSAPKVEEGLVPAHMLCGYQVPACKTFTGTIQC